jgi:hypothetical protein
MNQQPKTVILKHPEHDGITETVQVLRPWLENGRFIGQVFQFADGVRPLRFAEIRELRVEAQEVMA